MRHAVVVVKVERELRLDRGSARPAENIRAVRSWQRMTEAGWCVCAEGNGVMCLCMGSLLGKFRVANDILDVFFLLTTQLVVAPPDRSLVLALEVEMSARLARWFAFVAFLTAQATSEAA